MMMLNSSAGKRLGFILSNIHAGSSLKLWHYMADRALEDKTTLFVFPGGKVNYKKNSEHFRNELYHLANSSNIDGLISWASSLSGSVTIKELEDFHAQFSDIPYVSIGQKIPRHPCAEFDAYTGMKELHGAKKIAFIRAPSSHTSAEDRFRGYKDALAEFKIPLQENLITDEFTWSEGEKGIIQLCEERALTPGRDFDALLAASDLMALSAVKYLKSKNIRIPKDLMIGGFNDSEESRIENPSFSTVHMPNAELGILAYEKIQNMLATGSLEEADINLPAYPIIRESCGCVHTKIWNTSDAKLKIRTQEQLTKEACRIFRLNPETSNLEPIMKALFDGDKNKFYDLFTQRVRTYFEKNGELFNLYALLSIFRNANGLDNDYIEKIVRHVTVIIPRIQEQVYIEKQYNTSKTNSQISSLKIDLFSVVKKEDLILVLKKHLEKIGINTFALVLNNGDEYSDFIGGYNAQGEVHSENIRFLKESLVPERFSSDFKKGVYIVQPLFSEEKFFGYIICNYAGHHGNVYEDLRSSVNSALQSIFLFEETTEAKKVAEQAEFAKTEFFANVGSDLCDPLKDLSAKVQQMELNVARGLLDTDILTEQLLFLRSQIEAQLEKTETLVDLTRSQVDDLPMDKKLFDIRQVLPGSVASAITEDYPLLFGDEERLKRAIQTIVDYSEKDPFVSEKSDGIHIEFYSNKFDWQKPELLLAEKIILLQFGDVEKSTNYAEVILPWPNLAGLPPEKYEDDKFELCSFSENTSIEKFGKKARYIFGGAKTLSSIENVLLYWEPDTASIDEWIKIYGLRRNEQLFRTPLLCYSRNMIGHNFVEMLEQKIKTQRLSPVLFVNAKNTRYGTWATDSNTVSIASMSEFDEILKEIVPSIIVFESITEESIRRIRQNPKTVLTPILVIPDTILKESDVEMLCSHPKIVLCNRGAAESEQFDTRVKEILAGDEILPPHTGALVKKAILYLNINAPQQIVRWKLADTVHVSEDYLTRIFHKELGLSLWEYLNRYRIYIATKMLLETNDTIYEIAEKSGFQDQAYFCRVFKKIYGVPPGKIRSK